MSDRIRTNLAGRLAELGRSQRWLSEQLGRNYAYINQYIEHGTPRDLPYETKLKIAELLTMPLVDLGIAHHIERPQPSLDTHEDAEVFVPPASHFLARAPHLAYYRMLSPVLDQHPERILPSQILAVNATKTKTTEFEPDTVVVAFLFDKRDLSKQIGIIVRQFIVPNKLVTNSSSSNEIMSLDDEALPFDIRIKGVLMSVVRELN